jgi:uncharacterized protein YndB with AHSA1/START domain
MVDKTGSDEAGSASVEVSRVIERPVGDVFRFFAEQHVRNHPRWDPDIELEEGTGGPMGVGTVIRRRNTRYDEPVEGTMEVTEYEPNRVMGTVIREGGFEMSGRATLEELGPERTRLTQSAEFPESLDEELIRSKMERSSRRIRELIEGENEND